MKKFKEPEDSRYTYQNKLDKACFQPDMAYRAFKSFPIRTASDNILRDKVFNVDKNPNHDRYQKGQAPIVYKFLDKKSSGGAT